MAALASMLGPTESTPRTPPGTRVVWKGVSWDTYQRLAADRSEGRRPRLAFDQGWLEIGSPTGRHDTSGYIQALVIELATMEWERDVLGILSTTISRADIEAGFEAEQAVYIQNAEVMRAVDDVDMAGHPPPGLVIEVDVWNDSRRKLQLFAGFGVPEVWRVVDDEVVTYRVTQGEYERIRKGGRERCVPGANPDAVDSPDAVGADVQPRSVAQRGFGLGERAAVGQLGAMTLSAMEPL